MARTHNVISHGVEHDLMAAVEGINADEDRLTAKLASSRYLMVKETIVSKMQGVEPTDPTKALENVVGLNTAIEVLVELSAAAHANRLTVMIVQQNLI